VDADLANVTEGIQVQDIALVEQALPAASAVEADRWFLFDDFDVMPFDPAYLDVECFGGPCVKKCSYYSRSRSSSNRSSSSSSSNSSKSCESKRSSNNAGKSHSSQQSSGSVRDEGETSSSEELTIDHASTDVAESVTECVESIPDNADLGAVCSEFAEECSASPEKADESENGDADSVASSCGNENNANDGESSGSESNNSSDDSDSSDDDSSDESESESDCDSCSEEEQCSYIPTRGKFKSAFLLFYDRIDE